MEQPDAVVAQMEALKAEGNEALTEGRYYEAVSRYTEAVAIKETPVLYSNRALALIKIGKYKKAVDDAQKALDLDSNYIKAYYRKGQALDANREFNAADEVLVQGEELAERQMDRWAQAELKKLRIAVLERKAVAAGAPSIRHFDVLEELGTGNYSEIVRAVRKSDGKVFALKLIQKSAVDKIKKRHPNVHNEIQMEKRVLNKLAGHPNIVNMFGTFQDYSTLFYMQELCEGGELWARLASKKGDGTKMLPTHDSLAKFWMAQLVEALEFMHSLGIVHRDIKPENMMLTGSGHLKVIDFGTCKDLIETDLNGPEFAGTPEFMAPEMVNSKPPASYEADIWAAGIVAHQLLAGTSPFKAASPYLCFLRIKHANVELKLPECLATAPVGDFVRQTVRLDPANRLGAGEKNIKALRDHPWLAPVYAGLAPGELLASRPAVVVPRLGELALRAVSEHAATADYTEKRLAPAARSVSGSPSLNAHERATAMQYLSRTGALHDMRCFRLFFDSAITARCSRADACTRTYLGHTHESQGRFEESFSFSHVAAPRVSDDPAGAAVEQLRLTISAVNRVRPPFVVVSGEFTVARFGEEGYGLQLDLFRRTMARVSESIPVMYCCGDAEAGLSESASSSVADYENRFGASWYSFWCKGARFLVLNSPLLSRPLMDPVRAALQQRWIDEEFEITKVGGAKVFLISHKPIVFPADASSESVDAALPASAETEKRRWARALIDAKVDLHLTGATSSNCTAKITSKDAGAKPKDDDDVSDDEDDQPIVEDMSDEKGAESSEEEEEPDEEHQTTVVSTASATGPEPGVRVVNVHEYSFKSKYYNLEKYLASV